MLGTDLALFLKWMRRNKHSVPTEKGTLENLIYAYLASKCRSDRRFIMKNYRSK